MKATASYLGKPALGNMGSNPRLLEFTRNTGGNLFIEGDIVLFDEEMASWYVENEYCKCLERYQVIDGHYWLITPCP